MRVIDASALNEVFLKLNYLITHNVLLSLLQGYFRQDATETRTVDQIKSLFLVRKKLEGGVLGVVYDLLGFLKVRSTSQSNMAAMSMARLSLRTFRSSANNASLSWLINRDEIGEVITPLFSERSNLLFLSQAKVEVEST